MIAPSSRPLSRIHQQPSFRFAPHPDIQRLPECNRNRAYLRVGGKLSDMIMAAVAVAQAGHISWVSPLGFGLRRFASSTRWGLSLILGDPADGVVGVISLVGNRGLGLQAFRPRVSRCRTMTPPGAVPSSLGVPDEQASQIIKGRPPPHARGFHGTQAHYAYHRLRRCALTRQARWLARPCRLQCRP